VGEGEQIVIEWKRAARGIWKKESVCVQCKVQITMCKFQKPNYICGHSEKQTEKPQLMFFVSLVAQMTIF